MKKIRVVCFVCTCLLVYLFTFLTNSLRVQRLTQRLPDSPPNKPAEDGDGTSVVLEFAFACCRDRDRVSGGACGEITIGGEDAA